MKEKTHPVPTTHTPSTNYADNRYQQPLFRKCLCVLFIRVHGEDGDYEYALDTVNSAAGHLQVIQAELPATSPLARDAGILAKFVRAAQRNLSQQRPADNPDELLGLSTSLKEKLEGSQLYGSPAVRQLDKTSREENRHALCYPFSPLLSTGAGNSKVGAAQREKHPDNQ